MKRFLYIITSIIIIIIAPILTYIIHVQYSSNEQALYPIKKNNDDTLRIAYIGDSWAFMHKDYDKIMSENIKKQIKRPTIVKSFGLCGYTSKKIYKSLFSNSKFKKYIFEGYDYCFISAGINDSYQKVRYESYKENMNNIIKFMIDNNITPILLEIPDYNIQQAFYNQTLSRKILRKIFMLIYNIPIDCKQGYRDALNELTKQVKWSQKIHTIRYKSWNNNYIEDLKYIYTSDGMHLNKKGYYKLDSCITNIIIKEESNK